MVGFWSDDSTETLTPLRAYARDHNLIFTTAESGRIPNQIYVSCETKPDG